MTRIARGAAARRNGGSNAVLLLTGNHLCRNPRVIKEAAALVRAGFEVEVLGAWADPRLKEEDLELAAGAGFRFTPVVVEHGQGIAPKLFRFVRRVVTKSARVAYQATGLESRWQLGSVVGALGRAARSRRFDIAIAHSEPGLAVACDLQQSGWRVGIDLEDWFSEDLLPDARRVRPRGLLRELEKRLLQRGEYASCPSRAMSRALAEAYDCSPPEVIYNAFPWSDRASLDGLAKDRTGRRRASLHWYSQTLGESRGLEDLLAALPFISGEVELHLRGQPTQGFEEWFRPRIPSNWEGRILVHGLVPNAELLSRIAEHDIGFAGEMKYCLSRELTVTNKILHYLLAGLAVVASDTEGQKEIAAHVPEGVAVYASGQPGALAEEINWLLSSEERLGAAKAASLAAAEFNFCWERQESRLLRRIGMATRAPGSTGMPHRPSAPAG